MKLVFMVSIFCLNLGNLDLIVTKITVFSTRSFKGLLLSSKRLIHVIGFSRELQLRMCIVEAGKFEGAGW